MITALVAFAPYILIFMAGAWVGSLLTLAFVGICKAAKEGDRQMGIAP